jgi:CheY-like chemotaxis protein
MFDLMRRSIELEARLIDDLLDVTRIRQGKLRLDRETINLHALIAEVLETYRPQVEADGLTVEARLSARATWLRADPDRIRQVIWNLLQNALRNTPAAGAIELETRDGVPGMVVVRVRDNGRGMTPDVLDRVFQPFEQWPDRRGGLGLGLSICRGLVEAHGGRIIAASPGVGRGSTFEVELPTTPQPDISAVAPAHVSERAPEHGLRVLVVEDNQDTASALVELLELYGFEVRHAPTLECARRMATSDVDVIVSDLGLPDGSGLELLENARRPVRAIALSGYGMAEDVERSLAAGFTLHLTKPVAPDDLVEAIRRVANQ